jgi:hypothetical protein
MQYAGLIGNCILLKSNGNPVSEGIKGILGINTFLPLIHNIIHRILNILYILVNNFKPLN